MEKKILIVGAGKVHNSLFAAPEINEEVSIAAVKWNERFSKEELEEHMERGVIICVGGTDKATIEAVLAERGIKHSGVMLVGEAPSQTSELTSEDVVNLVALRTKEVAQRITIEEIDNKVNRHSYCQDDLRNLQKQNSQAGWKNRPKHRR